MKGQVIKFIRRKDFKFIKEIGQGGTGRAVLLEDETINERFVCKKYSPFYEGDKQLYFDNFKEEIKLLHLLHHRNIVRVFNYYLYPENFTGYILMEYINGSEISTYLANNPDQLNSIFTQVIDAFSHLEECGILHRDIRPENILISDNGIVKVIDFGFGKKIDFELDYDKSISLNWRYTLPSDFNESLYNFQTEIYFIGKLFEEIIVESNFQSFSYDEILKKMVQPNPSHRIDSFFEIKRGIISGEGQEFEFNLYEKGIYKNFADNLSEVFTKIDSNALYIADVETVILTLEQAYKNSMLEDYIKNNEAITSCFIKGSYRFYRNKNIISTLNLKNFISFLKSSSKEKQKVILNNIWQRLDIIPRIYQNDDDDLPF